LWKTSIWILWRRHGRCGSTQECDEPLKVSYSSIKWQRGF
jgi:hypothetical protein